MRIIFALALFSLGLLSLTSGQQVGESERDVRKTLGNPIAIRTSDERATWLYSEGRKVVFEKGVVVSNSGFAESVTTMSGKPIEAKAVDPVSRGSVSEVHVAPVKKAEATSSKLASRGSATADKRGVFVAIVGSVVIAICGIGLLIQCFRASVWWGLFVLFFPLAQLFFVFTHWTEAKKPFLIMILVGYPLLVAGLILGLNQ